MKRERTCRGWLSAAFFARGEIMPRQAVLSRRVPFKRTRSSCGASRYSCLQDGLSVRSMEFRANLAIFNHFIGGFAAPGTGLLSRDGTYSGEGVPPRLGAAFSDPRTC